MIKVNFGITNTNLTANFMLRRRESHMATGEVHTLLRCCQQRACLSGNLHPPRLTSHDTHQEWNNQTVLTLFGSPSTFTKYGKTPNDMSLVVLSVSAQFSPTFTDGIGRSKTRRRPGHPPSVSSVEKLYEAQNRAIFVTNFHLVLFH